MGRMVIKFLNRRALLLSTITFTVFLSLFAVLIMGTKSDAKDCNYIYKSILVEDGDTLNSLASRYIADSGITDHGDYVRKIERVNRLSSDKIISGAYLVIPVLDISE